MLQSKHLAIVRAALTFWDEEMSWCRKIRVPPLPTFAGR